MEIKILHRWSNACLWTGDIEDSGSPRINMGKAVKAALLRGADLRGADLRAPDLRGADLRGADLRDADLRGADLRDADLRSADLRDADLRDADLRGANLRDAVKIASLRVLTGLYEYQCMAFVTDSGAPWVRMGCLWKSVKEWDRITIRASNTGEFPDDGSAKCEERVRAFEFVRDMALRMAEEWKTNNSETEE